MMNTQLKKLFNQKVIIFSLIIISLWMVSDFSERFVSHKKNNNIKTDVTTLSELAPVGITQQQKQQIITLYQKYRTEADSDKNNKSQISLTKEQQEKQQGLLQHMFVGDNKIELKAIVSRGVNAQQQALLLVSNTITGSRKIEAFINNSQVYGYQLKITKSTQVILTRLSGVSNDNEQTPNTELPKAKQVITLTMYQMTTEK